MSLKIKLKKMFKNMDNLNSNKINSASQIVDSMVNTNVKVVKKDKGLMERDSMDDKKVILTEDNRQVLFG